MKTGLFKKTSEQVLFVLLLSGSWFLQGLFNRLDFLILSASDKI